QGDYDAYALYFSNAVSNPSIYDTTQRILKKQALADLKLKQEPSPDTSPLLRTESVQAKTDGAMFSPDALAKPTTPDGWKILKEMIKDTFFKDVKKRSYHDAAIDAANPNQ
ncbi:MAG TPA: hypothetical protein VLJ21_03735, partial [Candidatus Binatia bacterium]|nr:hypothetical protein [Candidatus Binatia bacterium]